MQKLRQRLRRWLGIDDHHQHLLEIEDKFEKLIQVGLKHKQRLENLERSQAASHRQLLAQTIALHDVLSGEDPEMYYQVIGRARNYRKSLDQLDNPTLAITNWLTEFKLRTDHVTPKLESGGGS